jgi:hypothetical protein
MDRTAARCPAAPRPRKSKLIGGILEHVQNPIIT